MGVVYRATDLSNQQPVALKRLVRAQNQAQITRFQREGEALARVNHPSIVKVVFVGEERGQPFIVLEFVGGHNLEEVLRGRGALDEDEAVGLARILAEALASAHARDVLHRDVKPENVLLPTPERPVLVDFGLAKMTEGVGSLTATGAFAGTPGYAAPEQLQDAGKVDARADVYGLGATLYALLTGGPPGGNATAVELVAAATLGTFAPPRKHRPELSREVDALVMKALAGDRGARYASMAEFADALAALERGPKGTNSGAGRGPGPLVALAALVGVGLGLGFALWRRGAAPPSPPASSSPSSASPSAPAPSAGASATPIDALGPRELCARLEAALWELQSSELPVLDARHRAFELASAAAEAVPATPELALALGRAHRERARWAEAIDAYERAGREPRLRARAQLAIGLTWLTRTDVETESAARYERLGLTALDLAVAEGKRSAEPMAQSAGQLAQLAKELRAARSALDFNATAQRIREARKRIRETDETPGRLLYQQEFHFVGALGLKRDPLLSMAGGTGLDLVLETPAPRWSPGYAYGFLSRFRARAKSAALEPLEALCRVNQGRGGLARALAQAQARLAHAGGLYRTFAAPEGGLSVKDQERYLGQARAATSTVGRFLGTIEGSGALRFTLQPAEKALTLWVRLPPGTQALDLDLLGPGCDLDLAAEQNGVPLEQPSWISQDLAHSEDLSIDLESEPPLRPGLVQVRIFRYRAWPAPDVGVLRVRVTSAKGERPYRWVNPWSCNLDGAPPKLRPALGTAYQEFMRANAQGADAALKPFQREVPRVALIRAKYLLGLGEFKGVVALVDEMERFGQPLPLAIRHAQVFAVGSLGDAKRAVELADAALALEPRALEVALAAARYERILKRDEAALRRLSELQARDPEDYRIEAALIQAQLELKVEGSLARAQAYLAREGPVPLDDARCRLIASLGRIDLPLAERLFARERARRPDPAPSVLLDWGRFLGFLGKKEEARLILASLRRRPLGPSDALQARVLLDLLERK